MFLEEEVPEWEHIPEEDDMEPPEEDYRDWEYVEVYEEEDDEEELYWDDDWEDDEDDEY